MFFFFDLTQLNGPVVDLNLYKCSTRRKIPVRSLVEPVTVELRRIPLPPPPNVRKLSPFVNFAAVFPPSAPTD